MTVKMISVETEYQHNIRSTASRAFAYHFSIEDFRDALIKALIKQVGDGPYPNSLTRDILLIAN